MSRLRYCQRCSTAQVLGALDEPHPCRKCGGTNFDKQPKLHSTRTGAYILCDWIDQRVFVSDAEFLRVQRIKPD